MKRLAPILMIVLILLAIFPANAQTGTYYTLQAARVRSCPSRTCKQIGTLLANSRMDVIATVDGQKYNGTTAWRQITFEGQTGYVHSSLTTTLEPGRLMGDVVITAAPISVPANPPPLATSAFSVTETNMCNGLDDLDCSDFLTQAEANAHLQMCGVDEDLLDANLDTFACEALPA